MSQFQMKKHEGPSPWQSSAAPQPAAQHGASHGDHDHEMPWWVYGPHNLQRATEILHAPVEVDHLVRHRHSVVPEVAPLAEQMGRSPATHAVGTVSKLARCLGGLGVAGGALELYEGIDELRKGDRQQGGLDTGAGLIGIGAGGLALAGSSLAFAAAPAAAAIGSMAFGNKFAKKMGLFGTDAQGHNRSGFDVAGEATADAFHTVDDALGGGVLGTIGGGAIAGLTGVGSYLGMGVANALLGVAGTGYELARAYDEMKNGKRPVAESPAHAYAD